MLLIACLSLLGYSLLLCRFIRWPIESTIFFIVSAIIVINYIAAYFGLLQPISEGLLWMGGAAFLLSPVYLWKERSFLWSRYFTPGLVLFWLLIIVFGLMAYYLVVLDQWDELGRWLPYAKHLHHARGFFTPQQAPDIQIDYPPGTALWYYYFMQTGAYKENTTAFAHLFLIFTPLLLLVRHYTWKIWLSLFIASILFLTLLLLMKIRFGPVGSVMVDGPTALFFGGVIASYFSLKEIRSLPFYLFFPAMALVLLKPMNLPFVAVAFAVVFCDQIYSRLQNKSSLLPAFYYLGMLFLPASLVLSWNHYLLENDVIPAWRLDTFLHPHSPLTALQYVEVVRKYSFSMIPALAFIAILGTATFFIYKKTMDRTNQRHLLLSQALLLLAYIFYLLSLFYIYLYHIQPHLALQLNSLYRFLLIFYGAWIVIILSQILYFIDTPVNFIKMKRRSTSYLFASLLILLVSVYSTVVWLGQKSRLHKPHSMIYLRSQVQKILSVTASHIPTNARVGLIWTGNDTLKLHLLAYELLPRQVFLLQDDRSKEQFKKLLPNLDYLFLVNDTSNLKANYYSSLSPLNRTVFQIDKKDKLSVVIYKIRNLSNE